MEITFSLDGREIGGSVINVNKGKIDTAAAEDEFFALLRKNEKSIIEEIEGMEKSDIIDKLTHAQEDILKEAHAKDYHGTDDDMPDAYEAWIENLTLEELKSFLGL